MKNKKRQNAEILDQIGMPPSSAPTIWVFTYRSPLYPRHADYYPSKSTWWDVDTQTKHTGDPHAFKKWMYSIDI